jgi:biopolymer transport protein ExbD
MARNKPSTSSGIQPNLPITPMLDMAFQLLFFFVVTYNPADFEGQMDLALPSDKATQAKKPDDVRPDINPSTTIEIPADVTVTVTASLDPANYGLMRTLQYQTRTESEKKADNLPDLKKQLIELWTKVENKEAIKLQGHDKLKWSEVIRVMDTIREAGFQNISFVPPPDFQQAK